jgi:hypothetical protein
VQRNRGGDEQRAGGKGKEEERERREKRVHVE